MGVNTGFIRKGEIHDRQVVLQEAPVARFTASDNTLGMYVVGSRLYDNGSVIAVSAEQNPQLVVGTTTKFGEVDIVTEGKVINITLENYNKLYNHQLIAGYKYFDPMDVYRIVSDVANAPQVTYVRDSANGTLTFTEAGKEPIVFPEMKYLLYNNVAGEDIAPIAEDMVKTVKYFNAPYLCVRYFNPRVKTGNSVQIPVCVDNYFADYMNGRTINDVWSQKVTGPYTLELIVGENGTPRYKTIYAGESMIETPVFVTTGETFVTLRCIDSDGVSSATHYLDILVEPLSKTSKVWEVSDGKNGDLERYHIYPDGALKQGHTALQTAWLNKMGLTQLFADAVSNGYTHVVLPEHTYQICDYKNQGTEENIELHNDEALYWYCELEEDVVNGEVVGNHIAVKDGVVQFFRRTEAQVMADHDELFRYHWYNDNQNYHNVIIPAITAEQAALVDYYKDLGFSQANAEYRAKQAAPIPEDKPFDFNSAKFGDHTNSIVYRNNRSGGYHFEHIQNLHPAVDHAFEYFNKSFHTLKMYSAFTNIYNNTTYGVLMDVNENTTSISNVTNASGVLLKAGKYYFVKQGAAIEGDSLMIPSGATNGLNGFTIDLNGSTIEVLNQYEYNTSHAIVMEHAFNTHIKNGKILCGLETCEFTRAISRIAYRNPYEHVIPLTFRGNRFCSMENVTIEGALGFTIGTDIDTNEHRNAIDRYHAFTPTNYTSSSANDGSGMYDHKRLLLVADGEGANAKAAGSVADAYSFDALNDAAYVADLETFVMSDTAKAYGTDPAEMGFINLAVDRLNEDKFVFVNFGANFFTMKGLRKEIFVFFYNDQDALVKVVKTRMSWMVRVPTGATKVRVMGYGHSIILAAGVTKDNSAFNYMGVSQCRSTTGMVYKDCKIEKVRSAIVGGCERQVLYENVWFKDVASADIINKNDLGSWDAITWCCIDIESGSPMAKYVTLNKCGATISDGYRSDASIILQGGENIQVTNCRFALADWGLWSGLIKGNTFFNIPYRYPVRCWDISKRDTFLFHRFVQYDENTIEPMQDTTGLFYENGEPKYCDSMLISVAKLYPEDEDAQTYPAIYHDERELVVPVRGMTINRMTDNQKTNELMRFRNSKIEVKSGSNYVDTYID